VSPDINLDVGAAQQLPAASEKGALGHEDSTHAWNAGRLLPHGGDNPLHGLDVGVLPFEDHAQ
jgi:hypothetical protein